MGWEVETCAVRQATTAAAHVAEEAPSNVTSSASSAVDGAVGAPHDRSKSPPISLGPHHSWDGGAAREMGVLN